MLRGVGLYHFRSYDERTFRFSPAVTIISGPNGSGKTNILEALFVAYRGSSFRGSDQEALQFSQEWWRLLIKHEDSERTVTFDSTKTTARKQFTINGAKRARLSAQFKLPVVLFEPNDLRLLDGSPARRRDFIDDFIAQLEPAYATIVGRYDRALKQRNNLLKQQHVTADELFVWDVTLSEAGAHIIRSRAKYTEVLNHHLSTLYQSIAHTSDTVRVVYSNELKDEVDVQQRFMLELHKFHKRDQMLGFTSIGPHRDDIIFFLNANPAAASASRGETRSIVLSLKLLQIELLRDRSTTTPLLLLDDVFSELDSTRRQALIDTSAHTQTIITTTDADVIKQYGNSSLLINL
ncbi:DNA replication/repair protein RecF [Candidatus Saccharibacteria bacterium]|nr:MAG: DNA replication/repair protein RecF [Candidatus Saccharibacteria bacterium]